MSSDKNIGLSYVLTTFNKLSYLRLTLSYLIQNKLPDEEILVTDGGSGDGTAEYLQTLFNEGKIDWFSSEKDHGEAHGTNKAILRAKGTLIKIITDDDVFDFNVIHSCKEWMLQHPDINVVATSGGSLYYSDGEVRIRLNSLDDFKPNSMNRDVWFSGLSILFRRDALPLIGLLNSSYKIVDFEYIHRIKGLSMDIALYNDYSYLNIINPASNSLRFHDLLWKEHKKITFLYHSNFFFRARYYLNYLKKRALVKVGKLRSQKQTEESFDYEKCFTDGQKALHEANSGKSHEFKIKRFAP
jgi:glycosyltransferase involved in cell wall biosynthesis